MRVGDYELGPELGRGGMGAVYRARHVELGRDVALKRLLKLGGRRQQRFEAEAQALAKLRHPNVVTIHEVGVDAEGSPFIAMGLVEGESLADLLRRGPLSPRRAAEIARDVALALDHAQQAGILHRDVKPANVLIRADGAPILTDFGLARHLTEERERLTRTGQLLGTPHYMAPEQAASAHERIGPETDVYGLGATLYAMLTGAPPIQAEGGILALVAAICERCPDPPGADPALDAITLTCLAKSPSARYADAGVLAHELTSYLSGGPISATTARLRLRPPRRLALWVALVAVAVVGIVAVVAALDPARPAARASSSPEPTPTARSSTAEAEAAEALSALGRESDPARWRAAVRAWLARYPAHEDGAALRARYLARGLAAPSWFPVTGPRRPFTLYFLSPRRVLGLRDLDSRFDLWHLRGGVHRGPFGRPVASIANWGALYAPEARTVLQRRDRRSLLRWSLAGRRPRQIEQVRLVQLLESEWAVAPDGRRLAVLRMVGRTNVGERCRVEVFDLTRPTAQPTVLEERKGNRRELEFVGSRRLVLEGEGEVLVYDLSRPRPQALAFPDATELVAHDLEARLAVVTRPSGRVALVDALSGAARSELPGTPRVERPRHVQAVFLTDPARLLLRFAGSPSTWELWGLDPAQRLQRVECGLPADRPQAIASLRCSPDGARVAGVSWDDHHNVVASWEVAPAGKE